MTCSAAPVQLVAVANDITFSSGSFGTKEDAVFRAATEYALEEKLPIIYLAANAGARVGLAQEIKQCLQVALHLTPLLHAHLACCNRFHVFSVSLTYAQLEMDTFRSLAWEKHLSLLGQKGIRRERRP